MQFNVYLDTTGNRRYLAQYLDIAPGSIVQIEQIPADFSNLKIVQVTGIGKVVKSVRHTPKAVKRYTTPTQHPDAALLDHKSTLKIMVAMAGGSIQPRY